VITIMVFIKTSFFFILSILTSGNSLVVQKGASNHGKNDNGGRLTKAKQAKEDQTLKAKSLEAQSNENVPRLVGFQQGVFNKDCLDFANSKYTHIIVAFVVTYTGFDGCTPAPDCYSCSTTCQLLPVARDLCKDASGTSLQLTRDRTDLTALQAVRDQISKWRGNNERKVLISIGGAGQDKCWSTKTTACKDNQGTLASDLANLVTDYGFDGVDIDYEVSPANKAESDVGQEDLDFLKEFTKSLRTRLPAEKLLSHSPRDDAMESKAEYFKSLQKDAEYRNSITWIQPQFYNGMRNVVKDGIDIGQADNESAKTIFGNLVKLFGDANKVGFGFCLKDCTPVATSTEAISVIQKIKEATNICAIGGVFMWELANDSIEGTSWGNSVADEALKSSCAGPVTQAPTTLAPVTTLAPTTLAPMLTPAPTPIQEDINKTPVLIRGVKIKKGKAKSPVISKAKSPKSSKAKSPKSSKGRLFQTVNTNPNQVLTVDQLQNICSNYCVNYAAGVASSVTISGSSSHISSTATSVTLGTTVSTASGNYSG